jgi:photosystem II protein
MSYTIQFIPGINEEIIPTITLTRSKNGNTGTAIFKFKNPISFKKTLLKENQITSLTLVANNDSISTKNLKIKFINGKPAYILAIFVFNNSTSWINFKNFMQIYTEKNSLVFKNL